MSWVQLIFDSSSDLADQLSELLTECGAAAVTFQDSGDQPIYQLEIDSTPLWGATQTIALFDATTDTGKVIDFLTKLLAPQAVPNYRIEAVADKDWVAESLADFKPISFGNKLWICPSWHHPPDADAINIILDPGLAFGTGTHPTTALCLDWLDLAEINGKTVIDYGCGSGILAIAAALLGAAKVIAIDIDPQALAATQANAKRNSVEVATYLPEDCPNIMADILLANILAAPLQSLATRFAQLTHSGATIVLSGILDSQADTIRKCYQTWFAIEDTTIKGEWVRIVGQRHHD